MKTTPTSEQLATMRLAPDAITLFSFAWAAQSLSHLSFFNHWYKAGDPLAWVLLLMCIAVILLPGRLRLFMAMLVADIVYFTSQLPFVSNHILVSMFMSLTILGAALSVYGARAVSLAPISADERNEIFARFAPVLGAIFVLMYYAILVSKLNHGFFDLEVSCMTAMYAFYTVQNPLIGFIGRYFDTEFLFYVFMIIEAALPILLTFRKTRLAAVYIGVPFHLLLGIMSHWSFSSMMLGLYLLIAMPAILPWLHGVLKWLGPTRTASLVWVLRGYAAIILIIMAASALTGPYGREPFGWRFDFVPFQWLIYASILGAGIMLATLNWHVKNGTFSATGATLFLTARPGWLWILFAVAVLNSTSPYTGFKTETSVAMYSNMRTEGGRNNHFFMPALRLFPYVDDLIEVIDSNEPAIKALRSRHALFDPARNQLDILIPAFELRRAIGQVKSGDLEITYRRDGEVRQFRRGASTNPDSDLDQPPPWWLAKLVYLRPVFVGEKAYCLH